jgi:hypothetical protein
VRLLEALQFSIKTAGMCFEVKMEAMGKIAVQP